MKIIISLFITLIVVASCESVFEIDKTIHSISFVNESDSDVEVRWSLEGVDNMATLNAREENVRSSTTEFLTQSGDQNELEIPHVFDQFDHLIISITAADGSIRDIDLQSLNINPSIRSDGFMSQQEWYYTFQITNENLN